MTASESPNEPSSLSELLRAAAAELAAAGVPTPDVDAELLAAHVWGLSRGALAAAALRGDGLPAEGLDAFATLVERRAAREPLQHLTGVAPFRHLELRVGPGVFVPRPETEMVAQLAIDALRATASPQPVAVDLGTGSGAIALALATERPGLEVWGVDASPDALAVARANLGGLGMAGGGVRLLEGSWFDPLPEGLRGRVDLIVANPPYVRGDEDLDPSVREWEPAAALVSGPTGLEAYEVIVAGARDWLAPDGVLVLEIGVAQAEAVTALAAGEGFVEVRVEQDHAGLDRCVIARRG